ncbi:MAG TPA: hypothetical protein VHJ78_07490 [Actinomycetota bacterium]|nr:hypothetical protein [Actinomycetota bacterium]
MRNSNGSHACNPPVSRPAAKRVAALALLLMLAASACNNGGTAAQTEASPTATVQRGLTANSPVTLTSVGPVVVGMTIEQISAAAGVALTRQPDFDQAMAEKNCAYVSPSTIPGYIPPPDSGNKSPLAFMIVDGKLARIDILGGDFATAQGIKVGSEEKAVIDAYGNGEPLPPRAFIGPPYRYLTATPKEEEDKNYRMVFESDGAKVVNYRVGQLPQVENRQGCTP